MKRIALILTFLTVSLTFTFGQTVTDSITMKKVFGGYQFYQNKKILNMNQLVKTMQPNEQAYKRIRSAQTTYTFAMMLSCAGGFMVGWPIGTAIGGGDPEWAMAGIGAGLIVIAIPISSKFNKQAKLAVDTYNGGLPSSSFWDKNELRVSVTGSGIGLALRF